MVKLMTRDVNNAIELTEKATTKFNDSLISLKDEVEVHYNNYIWPLIEKAAKDCGHKIELDIEELLGDYWFAFFKNNIDEQFRFSQAILKKVREMGFEPYDGPDSKYVISWNLDQHTIGFSLNLKRHPKNH
jgi:hypothetical protein